MRGVLITGGCGFIGCNFLRFFFAYVATMVGSTLLIALHGVPVRAAFSSTFACLNITGAALDQVGTSDFYAAAKHVPAPDRLAHEREKLLGSAALHKSLWYLPQLPPTIYTATHEQPDAFPHKVAKWSYTGCVRITTSYAYKRG